MKAKETDPTQLQAIIDKYPIMFTKPIGMPPHRRHDHHIPLKDDSSPVSQRPYRYPQVQKAEIERIV